MQILLNAGRIASVPGSLERDDDYTLNTSSASGFPTTFASGEIQIYDSGFTQSLDNISEGDDVELFVSTKNNTSTSKNGIQYLASSKNQYSGSATLVLAAGKESISFKVISNNVDSNSGTLYTPATGTQYYRVVTEVLHKTGFDQPSSDISERIVTLGADASGTDGTDGADGIQGAQGNQGIQGVQGAQGATGNQGVQGAQGDQGNQGVQGAQGNQGIQGVQGAQGNQGIQGVQGAQGATGNQGIQGAQGATGNQGIQGAQGNQGIQGAQGDQGNQGVQGAQGNQGIQGVQGAQGATGNQGIQGAQGNQGIQGAQGATGNQGVQGAQGAAGTDGIAGSTGNTGNQGAQGATGNQGVQGAQGNQGNQGVQGAQGATGNQGIQGAQGATGNQGVQGAQGNQGNQGVQGAQGATGNQGVQGAQGNQGNQGVQGAQGNQGNQGVQGAQGATGNQGVQGAQGNQGNQGDQGIQGVQGAQGDQGIQGVQGAQGNQGIQGVQGAQGATGNQGVQGAQGDQGNQGVQGAQGNQGIQGVQGAQGATGNQGIQGAQGATGNQGVQGAQGATGNQGIQGAQGATGNQGVQGAQGATGNQGVQGAQGATGNQGVQGAQGNQGNQGIQGAQGNQGNQGIQGAQGATGSRGVQGAQGSIGLTGGIEFTYIGSATSVAGNSGYVHYNTSTNTVTISNRDTDANNISTWIQSFDDKEKGTFTIQGAGGDLVIGNVNSTVTTLVGTPGGFSFTLTTLVESWSPSQGDKVSTNFSITGDIGAQGVTGNQGVQGAQGNQGNQGVQGAQGATGTGIQGAQGDTGAGTQGAQGATGNQGAQGASGSAAGNTNFSANDLTFDDDREHNMDGFIMTLIGGSGQNEEAFIIDSSAAEFTFGSGVSGQSAQIQLKEASGNGANTISLKAPTALSANILLTLPSSTGSADQVLKVDGSGNLSFTDIDITKDTAPVLGGDLDVNGNNITSNSNGDVVIDPAGTGSIILRSDSIVYEGSGTVTLPEIRLTEATALGSDYVGFKPPISITTSTVWVLPGADGTTGQALKTDGSGNLGFATYLQEFGPSMTGTVSIKNVSSFNAQLRFFDNDESNSVTLRVPANVSADYTLTLPPDSGDEGKFLETDGSGVTTWSGNLKVSKLSGSQSNGAFGINSKTALDWTSSFSVTAGNIYRLASGGGNLTFANAQANSEANGSGMLFVATNAGLSTEMLIEGVVKISSSISGGVPGDLVYLSDTSAGGALLTAPGSQGDLVRIVGYVIDGTNGIIYFNPSSDWVELS